MDRKNKRNGAFLKYINIKYLGKKKKKKNFFFFDF